MPPRVSALQRLPFWGAVPILAAGTVAGVYLLRLGVIVGTVVMFAAVALFAAAYLREYSRLPGPPAWLPEPRTTRSRGPPDSSSPATEVAVDSRGDSPESVAPPTADEEDLDPEYDPVAEADQIDSTAAQRPPTDDA